MQKSKQNRWHQKAEGKNGCNGFFSGQRIRMAKHIEGSLIKKFFSSSFLNKKEKRKERLRRERKKHSFLIFFSLSKFVSFFRDLQRNTFFSFFYFFYQKNLFFSSASLQSGKVRCLSTRWPVCRGPTTGSATFLVFVLLCRGQKILIDCSSYK